MSVGALRLVRIRWVQAQAWTAELEAGEAKGKVWDAAVGEVIKTTTPLSRPYLPLGFSTCLLSLSCSFSLGRLILFSWMPNLHGGTRVYSLVVVVVGLSYSCTFSWTCLPRPRPRLSSSTLKLRALRRRRPRCTRGALQRACPWARLAGGCRPWSAPRRTSVTGTR